MTRGQALLGVGTGGAILAILIAERRRPSRPSTQAEPARTLTNMAMGAGAMLVVATIERPLIERLSRAVEQHRIGLAQQLPPPVREAAAFLLLDWAMYGWHRATHRVPALWRLHLVHHVDQDMDASTALRFHALDMLVSLPFRLAQVAIAGAGPRAHRTWQRFFFLSVLFHHSRVRLSPAAERRLSLLITTPGMHDIHHRADPTALDSNWSSGLSLWDHLHGSYRAWPSPAPIGIPGFGEALSIPQLLALPWRSEEHAEHPTAPAEP